MSQLYYFKPNVISQPLVNQWYAWSFLVAPQCAAMLTAFSHIPTMVSYIANPEMHEQALTIPELKGGQFIDLATRDTHSIAKLLAQTKERYGQWIDFAEAIQTLFTLLENYPDGASLEILYDELPTQLRGYVELVYDLQNQKSFRFIERMLYHSSYSTRPYQSVLLSEVQDDTRPFIQSTPFLDHPEKFSIPLPFGHKFYDSLYRTKISGITEDGLKKLYAQIPNANASQFELFKSFFTLDQPILNYKGAVPKSEVNIKYYGHACLLIQSAHCSILVDPLISYTVETAVDRFDYSDLPDTIDYLIFTHAHHDHVLIEHILQLRHKTKTVIVPRSGGGFLQDPSLKIFFEELCFKQVIEIDNMESVPVPDGAITGIPFFGEHGDLHIQTKSAYLINLMGKKILCAADSNNICPELYQKIFCDIGPIDALFIGMECEGAPMSWVYGTLFPKKLERKFDQSRRLNGLNTERALSLVQIVQPKNIFLYAMALEPWLSFIIDIDYNESSVQIIETEKLMDICNNDYKIYAERLFAKKEIILGHDTSALDTNVDILTV